MESPPKRSDDEARALLATELARLAPRSEALGEAGLHAVAGTTLQSGLEWEAALLAWGRARELEPRNVEALFCEGVCLLELGSLDEAADRFRAAAKLDDELEDQPAAERLDWYEQDPWFKLGNALHAKGALDGAIDAYEKSAVSNATAVEALHELTRCHLALKDPRAALHALDRLDRRAVRLSVRAEVNALRADAKAMLSA